MKDQYSNKHTDTEKNTHIDRDRNLHTERTERDWQIYVHKEIYIM